MASRTPKHVKSAGGSTLDTTSFTPTYDRIAAMQRRITKATRTPRHYSAKRALNPDALFHWLAYTDRAGYTAPYKVQVSMKRRRMAVFDSALFDAVTPKGE